MLPVEGESDNEHDAILTHMECNLGEEVPFEPLCSRDGSYEGDEVGFAIYSRDEVQTMISLLRKALKDGYKEDDSEKIRDYVAL